jgi:hypothetical protein
VSTLCRAFQEAGRQEAQKCRATDKRHWLAAREVFNLVQ